MSEQLCHCGKPLHYSDPDLGRYVEELIAERGEFAIVNTPEGCWKVPRHYIALHGLVGTEVPLLGFECIEQVAERVQ